MTNKKALSALVDGEVSEVEIHRLVREFGSDDTLIESWLVYQQIRAAVRGEHSGLDSNKQRQLFRRISQAVQIEDEYSAKRDKKITGGFTVASSLAVAACLLVAVSVGIQTLKLEGKVNVTENQREPAEASLVGSESQTSEMLELDEEKQRRLRTYLNQQDRMSQMNNYPKFVNYKEDNGN